MGLLKIDSVDLKKKLEPSPGNLIRKFESFMPTMLRNKNREVKEWLQQSVNSLKGVTTNIDDFVKQSMALKQI